MEPKRGPGRPRRYKGKYIRIDLLLPADFIAALGLRRTDLCSALLDLVHRGRPDLPWDGSPPATPPKT